MDNRCHYYVVVSDPAIMKLQAVGEWILVIEDFINFPGVPGELTYAVCVLEPEDALCLVYGHTLLCAEHITVEVGTAASAVGETEMVTQQK